MLCGARGRQSSYVDCQALGLAVRFVRTLFVFGRAVLLLGVGSGWRRSVSSISQPHITWTLPTSILTQAYSKHLGRSDSIALIEEVLVSVTMAENSSNASVRQPGNTHLAFSLLNPGSVKTGGTWDVYIASPSTTNTSIHGRASNVKEQRN